MAVRATGWDGVFTEAGWLLTRNLVPGVAVYGENLLRDGDREFRRWDANRSKLAAYLKCGGRVWPFRSTTTVLYLGAATGTTVSHLSDICDRGSIVAIEISPRAFRDFLAVAERRTNLVPILGDASNPEAYRSHLRDVDVVYQDVAQRDQDGIFVRNASFLRPGGTGIVMVKARSADVASEPTEVYNRIETGLRTHGFAILDRRSLDPYEADHAAIVVRKE